MASDSASEKPIESVWDYPRPPRLEPVEYVLEVVHAGISVARTTKALRVLETSQPPAYYFPPADVDVDLLRPTASLTFCEWKGTAAYADVEVATPSGEVTIADAAWTYPRPTDAFVDLTGYWAFYAQKMEACYVDGEQVEPNAGGFYGGWVTANITGPFKGGPGTAHW